MVCETAWEMIGRILEKGKTNIYQHRPCGAGGCHETAPKALVKIKLDNVARDRCVMCVQGWRKVLWE